MGISEKELEELQKRPGVKAVKDSREGCQVSAGSSPGKQKSSPDKPRPQQPKSRKNQTERRCENEVLWPRYQRGEIAAWSFESVKFRLADATFYTPDFMVIAHDCIEIVEVKGSYEREDARIKWKCAAEQFPWFRWIVARWMGKKKGWKIEEY